MWFEKSGRGETPKEKSRNDKLLITSVIKIISITVFK
jgi:hypothetical protein